IRDFHVTGVQTCALPIYNITGDKSLLKLAELLHKQGVDFTTMFEDREVLTSNNSIHCVNLAQGIKEPIVYYQQNPDQRFLDAVKDRKSVVQGKSVVLQGG